MTTATSYETGARTAKAVSLAAHLHLLGVTAEAAAKVATQEERDYIARQAGVRSPSETTWTLTVGLLLRAEVDTDHDPFDGLETLR